MFACVCEAESRVQDGGEPVFVSTSLCVAVCMCDAIALDSARFLNGTVKRCSVSLAFEMVVDSITSVGYK